ncbi:MAG: lamin tail domain-containing protein [Parabacteroides sp.]
MKQLFLFLCLHISTCLYAQLQPDILINEVMANPKGLILLPETEYVELHNTTEQAISLTDWWFVYGQTQVKLSELSLPAGGYVVLFRANRSIQVETDGLQMPLEKFPYQLNNDGKQLQLYDADWVLHDEVYYPKALVAISWERCGDEWISCTDERGGTPGGINSCGTANNETPEEPLEPDEPTTPELPDTPGTPIIPEEPEEPATNYTAGCVWINEVMADPNGLTALPQTEYVELYNRSDQRINLGNWQFVYGDKPTILTDYALPAQGYVVLYRSGREIKVDAQGGELPLEKFPSALLNTGKALSLLDPTGQVIDQITYEKAKAGIAWERSTTGFYLSTNPRGGTPGAANSTQPISSPDEPTEPETPEEPTTPDKPETPTDPETPTEVSFVQPGEIIFNEILPAPYTDGSEYIELYNRSQQSLSFIGLALATRKADGNLSTLYPLSSITTVLEPGGYALFSKLLSGVEAFYLIASPLALHEVKLPVLANNGATLVLLRMTDLTVIDEVSYSPKWHDSAIKDPKGVALERIDPDKPTQEATNWHSAAESAGYGTPGYRNSQRILPSGNFSGFERPNWSESERSYLLRYQLAEAGYRCRIWVFDTMGRRIAEITNLTTLGSEGTLRWDGLGHDGSRPKPGIYIFYAELFQPNGRTHTQREVFLIH